MKTTTTARDFFIFIQRYECKRVFTCTGRRAI